MSCWTESLLDPRSSNRTLLDVTGFGNKLLSVERNIVHLDDVLGKYMSHLLFEKMKGVTLVSLNCYKIANNMHKWAWYSSSMESFSIVQLAVKNICDKYQTSMQTAHHHIIPYLYMIHSFCKTLFPTFTLSSPFVKHRTLLLDC